MTVGKVVSQDASSVTVQMQDSTTKLITISASTTVSKTATGSASDITVGQNVVAFGSANSDGSVTAQNIQLNPLFRAGRVQDQAPAGK